MPEKRKQNGDATAWIIAPIERMRGIVELRVGLFVPSQGCNGAKAQHLPHRLPARTLSRVCGGRSRKMKDQMTWADIPPSIQEVIPAVTIADTRDAQHRNRPTAIAVRLTPRLMRHNRCRSPSPRGASHPLAFPERGKRLGASPQAIALNTVGLLMSTRVQQRAGTMTKVRLIRPSLCRPFGPRPRSR